VFVNFLIQPFANRSWRDPFTPKVIAGSYYWQLSPPPKDMTFFVVFGLTLANEGDISGSIQNIKFRVCFPKGDWVAYGGYFIDPKRYYEMFMKKQYDDSLWREPFRPVFLPPKSQIEKSVLFHHWTDFDVTRLEAGNFKSALSVQFSEKEQYEDIWSGGFFVDQGEINGWRKGVPIRKGLVTYIEEGKRKATLKECSRW
jgi:hypothetical protein